MKRKNDRKCPCVPMNDEGLSSLSFFSSERSSSLFSMAEVRKGVFGTRVPKAFDILLISSNLTNFQILNWKVQNILHREVDNPMQLYILAWKWARRELPR